MNKHYHTIDPLILETLNLNQERMNTILDILHGRTPQKYPKTERKITNRSMVRKLSPDLPNEEEQILPPIMLSKRKHTQKQVNITQKTI